jgi:arylformamidase
MNVLDWLGSVASGLVAAGSRRRRPWLQASFLLMAYSACGDTPKAPAPDLPNVPYGPHARNILDLWRAKSAGPTPLVVFIHGGAWIDGDKSSVPTDLVEFMLAHGVSVASVNYRYSGMAILPAPVLDAARAVQFLRSKARAWNLNPRRFGASGVSAGGCTALWLAYHDDVADPTSSDPILRESSRVSAALGISPQTSIDPKVVVGWIGPQILNHRMIPHAVGAASRAQLLERSAEWEPVLWEFSPINHVSSDDPPVMVDYPKRGTFPEPTAGLAIHSSIMGAKLKAKADAAGILCILRIEDEARPGDPKPYEFLLGHLNRTE